MVGKLHTLRKKVGLHDGSLQIMFLKEQFSGTITVALMVQEIPLMMLFGTFQGTTETKVHNVFTSKVQEVIGENYCSCKIGCCFNYSQRPLQDF